MKNFYKNSSYVLSAVVVLFVVFALVSLWYVRSNPLARDSNYRTYVHDVLKLSLLLPKDCTIRSADAGFVCKSSDYAFGPGLQKGYLLSLQAKYVSSNLKEEDAWRADAEFGLNCNSAYYKCSSLHVGSYPAEQISVPLDSPTFHYYLITTLILKDGIQYGLVAEALTKAEAEQITFQMLKQFSFSK